MVICFFCSNLYLGPPSDERVRETASFTGRPAEKRLIRLAKEALPDLVKALKDSKVEVKRYAAQSLANIGPPARQALPALEEAIKKEEDLDFRQNANEAIQAIKK